MAVLSNFLDDLIALQSFLAKYDQYPTQMCKSQVRIPYKLAASYTIQAQSNFPRTRVCPYIISGAAVAAAVLT